MMCIGTAVQATRQRAATRPGGASDVQYNTILPYYYATILLHTLPPGNGLSTVPTYNIYEMSTKSIDMRGVCLFRAAPG